MQMTIEHKAGAPAQTAASKPPGVATIASSAVEFVGWALFRPRPKHPARRAREFGDQLASLD